MNDDTLRNYVEGTWNCRLIKLPEWHPIDYYAERNQRMVAWVETKTRNRRADEFSNQVIDVIKWWACITHENQMGLPVWIVLGYTDGVVRGIRPAAHLEKVQLDYFAPAEDSVSLNAGELRPVIKVPNSSFLTLGTVSTEWP